jgi:hypothetical protein
MKLFSEKALAAKPQTRLEAIIYFWAHLDIEMIDSFLKNDRTYQDFPKYLFVSKLIKAFEQFEKSGDKVLTLHKGGCAGCSKGCRGFTFLGKRGDYMDILFLMEDDEIKDIYECSNFVNDEPVLNKLSNIELDPLSFSLSIDDAPF